MTTAPPIPRRPTAELAKVLAEIVEGLRCYYEGTPATQDNKDHLCAGILAGIRHAAIHGDLAVFGVNVDELDKLKGLAVHVENVMTANGERTRVWFDFAGTPLEAHTEPA